MAAYLIALVKVNDAVKLQEYAAAAAPTLTAFGAAPMIRGKVTNILAGKHNATNALIAKFADADSAHKWYNSPAYQSLIPLRDSALEPTFIVIEEPI